MLNIAVTDLHTEGTVHTSSSDAETPHLRICRHTHSPATGWRDAAFPEFESHPVEAEVKRKTMQSMLTKIPVRVLFDTPELNIKARYEAWSPAVDDMPVCIGDGARSKVLNTDTGQYVSHVCKGPSLCKLAARNGLKCSLVAKMPVEIEGSVLEFRTSSANSYRSLFAELRKIAAMEGGLRQLTLTLGVWQKSTRSSNFKPFTCASIKLEGEVKEHGTRLLQPKDEMEKLGADLLAQWDGALDVTEAEGCAEPESNLVFSPPRRAEGSALRRAATLDQRSTLDALFEPFIKPELEVVPT